MLQRMNELAVKSANGTNSEDDRSYIQNEIDQLVTEIDRVATTTKFNESYLLKGTGSDGTPAKLSYTTADIDLKLAVGGRIYGAFKSFFANGLAARVNQRGENQKLVFAQRDAPTERDRAASFFVKSYTVVTVSQKLVGDSPEIGHGKRSGKNSRIGDLFRRARDNNEIFITDRRYFIQRGVIGKKERTLAVALLADGEAARRKLTENKLEKAFVLR